MAQMALDDSEAKRENAPPSESPNGGSDGAVAVPKKKALPGVHRVSACVCVLVRCAFVTLIKSYPLSFSQRGSKMFRKSPSMSRLPLLRPSHLPRHPPLIKRRHPRFKCRLGHCCRRHRTAAMLLPTKLWPRCLTLPLASSLPHRRRPLPSERFGPSATAATGCEEPSAAAFLMFLPRRRELKQWV